MSPRLSVHSQKNSESCARLIFAQHLSKKKYFGVLSVLNQVHYSIIGRHAYIMNICFNLQFDLKILEEILDANRIAA